MAMGMVAGPAGAEEMVPVDRGWCVELFLTGGPAVSRAAEAALLGSEEDLREFTDAGYAMARAEDDRVRVEQLIAIGGPATLVRMDISQHVD